MSPEVIDATLEAADWMATPRPTWILEGTFWETICCAAELNSSLFVLWLGDGLLAVVAVDDSRGPGNSHCESIDA